MDMKAITAIASGDAEDASVLAAAAKLAGRFAAHVTVLPAFPNAAANLVSYGATLQRVPSEVVTRVAAGEREQQDAIEMLAATVAEREGLARSGAGMTVQKRELLPAVALAHEAVLSDILVMGAEAAKSLELGGLFAEALLSHRAPVLLIKGAPIAFGRAAIAWDGSAQAGRALRAALPILRQMKAVYLLTNVDDAGARRAGAEADIRAYLARHGVPEIITRQVKGKDIAASLIDAARSDACELLVAGGYGRPRLYELVLGGATRDFVGAEGLPHVLLAH